MSKTPYRSQSESLRLREAHAHLPWLGKALAMTSLEGCASTADALERIGGRADELGQTEPNQWILARSARVSGWTEGRWFSRTAFDRVTGRRPAAAMSFDHHAVFANSAALSAAGIDRNTPDPPGGVIERDSTGEPTGLLLEAAAFSLWAMAPEPSEQERDELILKAVRHLESLGFDEVHDLFSPNWLGPLLARMRDRGETSLSIGLYAPLEEIETHAELAKAWQRKGLHLLGGKIFTDGTLNSRTAWMIDPFADAPPGLERGKAMMTSAQIRDAVVRCGKLGLGIAMHAIGDGAVRACLDGITSVDEPLRREMSLRDSIRIEHCELIHESDIPRFAELGVVASVQPCHLLADVEALQRGVPDRLHRVMPFRQLLNAGLVAGKTLIFGSDVPVVRANPEDSIDAATNRGRAGSDIVVGASQAISREEALACFRPRDTHWQ